MSTITTGRVLLVAALALGLIVTAPAVSAHGGEPTAQPPTTDHPGADADASTWARWMESRMESHMGPGSVEWMESHMGLSVDEMARDMATGGHTQAEYGHDHGEYGNGHGDYGHGHGGDHQDHGAYGGGPGGYSNGHC